MKSTTTSRSRVVEWADLLGVSVPDATRRRTEPDATPPSDGTR